MDILSEVLHVIQLKSHRAARHEIDPVHETNFQTDNFTTVLFSLRENVNVVWNRNRFRLGRGDGLLVPAQDNVTAQLSCPGELPAVVIAVSFSFDGDTPHPVGSSLCIPSLTRADSLTDETEMGRILALLDEELLNKRMGSDLASCRFADVLLVELLRRQRRASSETNFFSGLQDPATRQVLEGLHESPNQPWSQASLAEIVGLSPSAMADRFQRLIGLPPLTYLRRWRLLRGKKELSVHRSAD